MASIKDDRGYNQGFAPSRSTTVRMQRRADMLLSEMELASDTRILEIGCGTGEVAYRLAQKSGAQVLGTDLCVPFIEEAREKYTLPNLRYEIADFNNPEPFSGMQFDYIVGNGILHHLYHHLEEAFANMKRLLKENGKVLFLEPNLHNPYVYLIFSYPQLRALANLEPGEMAFSKRSISGALSRAGFTDIKVDYKDFLIPGIPSWLIRPSILLGSLLEHIPVLKHLSQSLFIRAENGAHASPVRPEPAPSLVRYGISGGTAVAIQIAGLYFWVSILGLTDLYLWGAALAYCIAVVVGFSMQKYWTFREHSHQLLGRQMLWYLIISLGNLGLKVLILSGSKLALEANGFDFFHGWYLAAQAFAIAVTVLVGFSLNRLITFRSIPLQP